MRERDLWKGFFSAPWKTNLWIMDKAGKEYKTKHREYFQLNHRGKKPQT